MAKLVNNRWGVLRRFLLPRFCLLCDSETHRNSDICNACKQSLPIMSAACPHCAVSLGRGSAVDIDCGECQKRPPKYVRAHAAYSYAPPIDRLIHGLKYQGKLYYARVLGAHLAEHLNSVCAPRPDVIVPVPLHRSRLRERGYNQALEIARPLARRFSVPITYERIYRVRPTATQTELPRKKRRGNVRNAFQVDRDFSGLSVAVVDDVMTTGYTVDSFAACLRRAGAESVSIWVVARA